VVFTQCARLPSIHRMSAAIVNRLYNTLVQASCWHSQASIIVPDQLGECVLNYIRKFARPLPTKDNVCDCRTEVAQFAACTQLFHATHTRKRVAHVLLKHKLGCFASVVHDLSLYSDCACFKTSRHQSTWYMCIARIYPFCFTTNSPLRLSY
jgi:hypothetical protein